MRVRWESKQKAHVRAKCVRAKTSKCDVRACDGKIVALRLWKLSCFLKNLADVAIRIWFIGSKASYFFSKYTVLLISSRTKFGFFILTRP